MKTKKQIPAKLFAFIMALLMLLVSLPVSAFASAISASSSDETNTSVNAESETVKRDVIVLEEDETLRDENTKHFKLSDGTTKAVVYSQAVHYKDADGNWVDIDNALTLNGSEYSSNNKSEIKFANKSGSTGLVSIKDGDYKIDFTPLNTNKVSVVIENPQSNNSRKFEDMSVLNNLVSKAIYADIYDGIDIEYILVGNNIKENIIVKEKQDSYTFSFDLKLNKLSAELVNGAIILYDYDSGEQVYEIPVPYMYDANNVYSDSVEYSLVQNNKWKYTFTVTADAEWINADDRAFPVTVDPTVGVADNTITDITICDEDSTTTTSSSLKLGKKFDGVVDGYSNYIEYKSYIKINNLPKLAEDAYITGATLKLKATDGYGYVGAYKVLSDWDKYLTWDDTIADIANGTFDDEPVDYCYLSRQNNEYPNDGWYSWNIVDIARYWYSENKNYGLGLDLIKKENNNIVCFSSMEASESSRPVITITYRDMKGTESYWTYLSQNAGLAGSGSVNLATGNLVFEIPTLTTTDSIFSYTTSMIYNSAIAGEDYKYGSVENGYWYSFAATGFKLNINETLIKKSYINENCEIAYYYVWADADGTEHYFLQSTLENEESIYYDEDGLQLKLVVDLVDSNGKTYCKIVDSVHNERIFYILGGAPASEGLAVYHLEQLKDRNGNILHFEMDGAHKPNDIRFTPSGTSQKTQLLGPLYNSNKKVALIWCNSTKEGVLFRHSDTPTGELNPTGGIYLREALYLKCDSGISWRNVLNEFISDTDNEYDGITVNGIMKYEYNNEGYLTCAYNTLSDYKICYSYSNGKVVSIDEFGKDDELGQTIGISYFSGYTEVRTSGSDDIYGTDDDLINVYVFDEQGRAVTTYSTNVLRTEIYGAISGEYETENENAKNSISTSTVTGSTSPNYFLNGNFEQSQEYAQYWNIEGDVYYPDVWNHPTYEWNDYHVNLKVQKNGMSSLTQNVSLYPGDYTFSLDLNTYESKNLTIKLKATALDDSGEEFVQEIAVNETYASGSGGFASLSFNVNGEKGITRKFKVGIYLYGGEGIANSASDSATVPAFESIKVDNLMLSKSSGAQTDSWLNNGSFDQMYLPSSSGAGYWNTDYNSEIVEHPSSSSDSVFNNSLKINGSIDKECAVEQTIFKVIDRTIADFDFSAGVLGRSPETVFLISGFAKATQAMTNDKSKFSLKLEIVCHEYGSTEDEVLTEYFDFNSEAEGWQYITGTYVLDAGKFVTDIKLSCVYSNNIGEAYFDNISFKVANEMNPEVTQYYYNEDGKLQSEKIGNQVTYYGYDDNGNIIDVITNYQRTHYTYNENNQVIEENYYKHDSKITYRYSWSYQELVNSLSNLKLQSKVSYVYNAYGQITEQTVYDATESQSLTTMNTYDTKSGSKIFGALTKTETSLGEITQYFFDSNSGKLLANIQTDGTGTYYTYDALGNLTFVQPATYSSSKLEKVDDASNVEYVYNSQGQLEKILVNGTEYKFTYDAFGNQSSVSIGGNIIVSQETNDFNGKVTKAEYADGTVVLYEYDNLSRIEKVTYAHKFKEDFVSYSYEYSYDSNGNLSKFVNGRTNKTTIYQYDNLNRLIKFIEYDDEKLINEYSASYSYDDKNRLSSVYYAQDYKYDVNKTGLFRPYYFYGYNDDNAISSIQITLADQRNDYLIDYTYDSLKRFNEKTISIGAKNIITYGYANASSIVNYYKSTSGKDGGVSNTDEFYYSYDEEYKNITCVKDGDGNVLQKYTYDYLDRLVREDNSQIGKTYTYAYDDNGNILYQKTYTYTTGDLNDLTYSIVNYSYDNPKWTDQLTTYNGYEITYDEMGNPISYRNGMKLAWENISNLSSVIWGDDKISYTYNDSGIRTSKTINGVLHSYVLDGTMVVSEKFGDTLLVYLYDESASPIGLAYRTTAYADGEFDKYLFTKNLQGDIIGICDENGQKVVTYKYDAWGKLYSYSYYSDSKHIAELNPFRYRGYFYDTETGFYYLNSRYYDPQIKRFVNSDATGTLNETPMSLTDKNLYAYCDNNPVMRVDNGGQFWDTVFDVVSLAFSIVDVCMNPDDPWAWVGLAADAVDLIPFVTGVGEVTRAVNTTRKIVNKVDDVVDVVHDVGKAVDNITDAAGDLTKVSKKADDIAKIATTGTPNEIGKMGEQLAHIDPSKKVHIQINGRTRIPDALSPTVLTEVKNVKTISNTKQLRDFADYARQTNRSLELWVRPTTRISSTVIDAGWKIKYLW